VFTGPFLGRTHRTSSPGPLRVDALLVEVAAHLASRFGAATRALCVR
jgi:hypothetical protein